MKKINKKKRAILTIKAGLIAKYVENGFI